MEVFRYEDYKNYLRDVVQLNSQRGYLTQLATAAGCQKSYLSQVLRGSVHLTPEQALGLTYFWHFNENEEDFFLNLVHLGRAGNSRLQHKIKKHLKRIRDDARTLSKRFSSDLIENIEHQAFYYESWPPMALHMAVGIPSLRTVNSLSSHFNLPIKQVQKMLLQLERLGLVKRTGSEWQRGKNSIHLSNRSALTSLNHHVWRLQAVFNSQRRAPSSLHYSSVFSLSRKDFEQIRALIVNLLDNQRKVVGPSPDEIVACLNCDLFEIGGRDPES